MRLALLLAALTISAGAQTYRVAGVLVDADSGHPISRARIRLTSTHNVSLGVTTQADGAFSFEVPQDHYSLNAEHNDWLQVFGQARPSTAVGSAIITGPDQDTAHLIFRWFAPGAIFGKVMDDRGDPVENATIQVIRETMLGGRKTTTVAGTVRTDDLGNYRAGPFNGGNYYLVATAQPWYANQILTQMNGAYPATYYPGSTDPQNAARLSLAAGGELEANFTLRTVAAVSVHALCKNQTACNGTMNFYSIGIGDLEALVTSGYFQAEQPVSGIAPGHYVVRINGQGVTMRKILDIGSGGATIEVAFQPPPKVTGVVTFKNGKPRTTAYVRIVNALTSGSNGLTIAPDGSFAYPSAPIGKVRPLIGGALLYISAMSATGATLKDGELELAEGTTVHLNIEASDDIGRVKGLVSNDGKPVIGAMVVLVPAKPPVDAMRNRGFQTDSDGSFDFTVLPPGDYQLFVTDDSELEYQSAEALRPFLQSAKTVHVEAHQTLTENLTLKPR